MKKSPADTRCHSSLCCTIPDAVLEKSENSYKESLEQGKIVLLKDAFTNFVNRENEDKLNAIREKYVNVDYANYADYYTFEDIILQAEEPVCCQQLYAVLDGVIQEILSNENVNIDEIVKNAASDFQNNYLDNENNK